MAKAQTGKKTRRPSPRGQVRATGNGGRVRIRMYRQGIGDCFLLTFPAPDRPRHLLIDCGVHASTPKSTQWMKRIVADIRMEAQSHIDALVVTHEHWDHVSAFAQPELFKDVKIGELWLAWTEDPDDKLAETLGRDRAIRLTALSAAAKQLTRARQASLQTVGAAVGEVLSFFDPPDPVRGFSPRTRKAFDALKGLSSSKRYLKPGDLVQSKDSFPQVRFFVLGPPRDETLIKDNTGTIGVDDAQIGNWKSWTALQWIVPSDEGDTKVVRTKDLLGRTVFYKTGHHGSHNATRRPEGLESMTSRDLVAAIPVNREVASKLKGWDMPAPLLEAQLKRSTRGRLLRADMTWPRAGEPTALPK